MSAESHEDRVKKPEVLSEYRDLLSVRDLAKIFTVSIGTIYKEIHEGKFGSPIQIGRTFRIPKIYIIRKYFDNYN